MMVINGHLQLVDMERERTSWALVLSYYHYCVGDLVVRVSI